MKRRIQQRTPDPDETVWQTYLLRVKVEAGADSTEVAEEIVRRLDMQPYGKGYGLLDSLTPERAP